MGAIWPPNFTNLNNTIMATFKSSEQLAAEGNEIGARIRGLKETAIEAIRTLAPAELASTDWQELLHCIRGVPKISDDGTITVELTIKRGSPYGSSSREAQSLMPFKQTTAKSVVEILAGCKDFEVEYGNGFYEDEIATLRFRMPDDEKVEGQGSGIADAEGIAAFNNTVEYTRSETENLNLAA